MTNPTEQSLEHAEHAQHAVHDPFDRRVAMTIAIVAAVLACVTMLSHRAHNETLQNQIKSNDNITEASNRWAYFQAKKNRQYLYEACAEMLTVSAKDPQQPDAATKAEALIADWKKKVKKYEGESKEIEDGARKLTEKAEEYQKKAEQAHHLGDRFDLGELGVEFALVLCSVAILTKRKEFWLTGIGFGLLGLIVVLTGLGGLFLH